METKQIIEQYEDRLIAAMKSSNVDELITLLADSLVFTNQNGHLVTKADDIAIHEGGKLEIYSIETSARLIYTYDDVAVVSVVQDLGGAVDGHTYAGIYRYTRIWKQFADGWKVIAGHTSQIIN
ncbi:nuclear transport factor 2 family protein [Flavobacterium sp. RNTU_13]|uniref:nuclear transport factor 2 family protein n=1 Tax=Flavobacterium sp. RNTU_13 TaxID=3375145 RepID=UPI003987A45B